MSELSDYLREIAKRRDPAYQNVVVDRDKLFDAAIAIDTHPPAPPLSEDNARALQERIFRAGAVSEDYMRTIIREWYSALSAPSHQEKS